MSDVTTICRSMLYLCYISVMSPKYLMTNLARGKRTKQYKSSIWGSKNAVNGDYSGTLTGTHHCAHTNSWWQVYLVAVYDIKLVVIHNQRDCCGRLNEWADIGKYVFVVLGLPVNMYSVFSVFK